MKKIAILLIVLMIVSIGFLSGCNEQTKETSNPMIIKDFKVSPFIKLGETANLTWNVTGATTVSIDNGIGIVSLKGTRIIQPIQNTTYTLTATNATKTITATTQILVLNVTIPDFYFPISTTDMAIINTTMGTIRVLLYYDKMPITTANFIKLANDGFYNGLVFHRVIHNFMIQGGGFYPNGTQKQDPYGPIKLETSPDVLHDDGAISMARTTNPNSATSQFFICDGAQHSLDGQYAAFGKVTGGMDVVRAIAALDPNNTTTKYGNYQNWPVDDVIINSITIIELQ